MPYPNTIDNGAGERLTFMRCAHGTAGMRLEGETRVEPGAGPPMHVHYLQEEGFTVVRGRLGYETGDGVLKEAGPGETALFPPGVPHRFWNAGDDELLCSAWVEPAGNTEFFLGALFASQKANAGRRPSLFDVAFLCRRYRSEYALLIIPGVVQRTLFPLLVGLGTLLGRYRRYDGAPAPLKPTPTIRQT